MSHIAIPFAINGKMPSLRDASLRSPEQDETRSSSVVPVTVVRQENGASSRRDDCVVQHRDRVRRRSPPKTVGSNDVSHRTTLKGRRAPPSRSFGLDSPKGLSTARCTAMRGYLVSFVLGRA